jgi:hypothetical protein
MIVKNRKERSLSTPWLDASQQVHGFSQAGNFYSSLREEDQRLE